MPTLSSNLLEAAKSDPRQIRLIWYYVENGQCIIEVVECFNIDAMTFEINGDSTEVICTNIRTGENEVVAVIETGSTKKVTFDISRWLPLDYVSKFMELVRKNCGLRMFIARASECIDPFNVNDFNVLDVLGEVTFGNYNRTAMLNRDKSQAAAIEESTTVTAYEWLEASQQEIATRGSLHLVPIVDITLCDEKNCGGRCPDDSDGCQKWFWVDEDGIVGWTDNKFFTENILDAISLQTTPVDLTLTWTGPALSISCGPRDKLLVTDSGGNVYETDLDILLDNDPTTTPTWTVLSTDVEGNALPNLYRPYEDESAGVVWYISAVPSLYQYNSSLGTMTEVQTVPGLTVDFNDIDINGDNILIGGNAATLLWSKDGGVSFSVVTIIDPVTGLALDIGIDIETVQVLSDTNIAVGTSDDRVLYSLDSAVTWYSQLIYGQGAGVIADMQFDDLVHQVGFMVRNEGGVGSIWKTYYGSCEEWLEIPESEEVLPENEGLARIYPCPNNLNTFAAAGTSVGGAGLIFVGTTPTK